LAVALQFDNDIKSYTDNFTNIVQSTGGLLSGQDVFETDRFINIGL